MKNKCQICGNECRNKFCSVNCYRKKPTTMKKKKCKNCDTYFYVNPLDSNHYFCSKLCWEIYREINKKIDWGDPEEVKKYMRKVHLKKNKERYEKSKKNKCEICCRPSVNKYCSHRCLVIGITGKNNSNYIGGDIKMYDNKFTLQFRKLIRNRDKKCMECGRLINFGNRELDVHHIDNSHNNSCIKNCISLCSSCHATVTFGKDKYTYYMPKFRRLLNMIYGYKYDNYNAITSE